MHVHICTIVNCQQKDGSLQQQILRTTPNFAFDLNDLQNSLSKIIPGKWKSLNDLTNEIDQKCHVYYPPDFKGVVPGCTFVEISTIELKESTSFEKPFS